ncbi:MAG: cytochrome P450 [Rhodobacteraceae bacterium]|nr:cytochrome P450 [Paracoccaceae bacterium]
MPNGSARHSRKAFKEGIRWVAPIQTSSRRATEDTEIRGCEIAKDQIVMTLHDNPETYDPFRADKTHHSFANGPHFCQGAHIARMMLSQILLPGCSTGFPIYHWWTRTGWSGTALLSGARYPCPSNWNE